MLVFTYVSSLYITSIGVKSLSRLSTGSQSSVTCTLVSVILKGKTEYEIAKLPHTVILSYCPHNQLTLIAFFNAHSINAYQ